MKQRWLQPRKQLLQLLRALHFALDLLLSNHSDQLGKAKFCSPDQPKSYQQRNSRPGYGATVSQVGVRFEGTWWRQLTRAVHSALGRAGAQMDRIGHDCPLSIAQFQLKPIMSHGAAQMNALGGSGLLRSNLWQDGATC